MPPVDAGLVVVTLEVAGRGELDQVPVTLVRLGQEGQVRISLLLPGCVVADVDLATDQRLDAGLLRVLVELNGAGKAAMIGERDGGHLELCSAGGERGNTAGPVEDRVLGVDVKVDELSGHSRAILGGAQDGSGGADSGRWSFLCYVSIVNGAGGPCRCIESHLSRQSGRIRARGTRCETHPRAAVGLARSRGRRSGSWRSGGPADSRGRARRTAPTRRVG